VRMVRDDKRIAFLYPHGHKQTLGLKVELRP
jgi:hypothetical protein